MKIIKLFWTGFNDAGDGQTCMDCGRERDECVCSLGEDDD
jgi:hypothetical protein